MANPFSKGWKYMMSSFDQKIDENADPKVQIQQAVQAAKEQHQQISEHAAEIIGHKSQPVSYTHLTLPTILLV